MLQLTDVQALENTDWDIAVKRSVIRVNGGDSGPGNFLVARLEPMDWDDIENEPPESNIWNTDEFMTETCEPITVGRGVVSTAFGEWYNTSSSGGIDVVENVIYSVYSGPPYHQVHELEILEWNSGYYVFKYALWFRMLIAGTYENETGQTNWLTKKHWVIADGNDSVVYDIGGSGDGINFFNGPNFFMASNSADPENVEWIRVDWKTINDEINICLTATGLASREEALAAGTGFDQAVSCTSGWMVLHNLPPIEIEGEYEAGGIDIDINSVWWQIDDDLHNIVEFNNDDQWAITQNAAENGSDAELFSRFEWVIEEDSLWTCQVISNAVDETEAAEPTATNSSDPANSGCNGGPWIELIE